MQAKASPTNRWPGFPFLALPRRANWQLVKLSMHVAKLVVSYKMAPVSNWHFSRIRRQSLSSIWAMCPSRTRSIASRPKSACIECFPRQTQ